MPVIIVLYQASDWQLSTGMHFRRPRHHSATAKQYCPSSSVVARQRDQAVRFQAARFWAEPIEERFDKVGTYEIYPVASNLVNGLPPRYRDDGDVPPTSPRKR
jgi:hypothetical protein